jgi:uncharacterized membrane protein
MATNESVANSIKIWAFPTLVTCLSVMIWTDVREIQTDVKHLMAESNINGTKLEGVDVRVTNLEQAVFLNKAKKTANNNNKPKPIFSSTYAVLVKEDDENKF